MLRRLLLLTALALGFACGIDDLLVGAACNEDADCPNLTCVRTATEAAEDEPGLCSSDGSCVQGEQAGCITNTNGMCGGSGLVPATGPDGGDYCCPASSSVLGIPTVISVSEDNRIAVCFVCTQCSDNIGEEACMAGEARCDIGNDGAPCGCRPTDDALVGESCDDDDDCGSTGVCVRTLEEEIEPDEPIPVDRDLEQGACRPSDTPTCTPDGQSGCGLEGGGFCPSSTNEVDVGTRLYCCQNPSNNADFHALPYVVSDDLTSVACTTCSRAVCPDELGNTQPQCTELSDPTCIVAVGVLCGCPPMTE